MSVKASFKTASKRLKCGVCKASIEIGERYFEARAPFSKTVTNCIPCVKKAGIFTDEEIQANEMAIITASKIVSTIAELKRNRK